VVLLWPRETVDLVNHWIPTSPVRLGEAMAHLPAAPALK
jgi:hypothetical protein